MVSGVRKTKAHRTDEQAAQAWDQYDHRLHGPAKRAVIRWPEEAEAKEVDRVSGLRRLLGEMHFPTSTAIRKVGSAKGGGRERHVEVD